MLDALSLKVRLLRLAGLIAVLVPGFGAFMAWQVSALQMRFEQRNDRDDRFTMALMAVEQAHVAFKIEVREWKNILLRGRQRDDFDTCYKQFRELHLVVRRLLARAPSCSGSAPTPQISRPTRSTRSTPRSGSIGGCADATGGWTSD